MAQRTDWLPGRREQQLAMSKNWVTVLEARGSSWGVTDDELTELKALTEAAENALAKAMSSGRTEVVTALCKEAFDKMSACMRNLKARRFFSPPMTDADLISLGLRPKDSSPTSSGAPTARVNVKINHWAPQSFGFVFEYVDGRADDPANKEYHLWYKVVSAGEAVPTTPDDLTKCKSTKRKKDLLNLDYADSGKTCFMAVQLENNGQKGPWGPLTSSVIP